ncbi:MAG TPA: 16S rRNA (adenine(1518)-N(6)/adenine(1519)-N(6))-dimethyltransferase RsmA [Gammaproteobacteria bacterium]|nr:16S rRNA (adenine(1518)-N(6)/adenine(1519)-N(6))-dimethyltransferase RsmA [Gammaproteobacteria bacterium]
MTRHRPRKRFGQHFLTDPSVIEHIVRSLSPRHDQHLVEIGPGRGALTHRLIQTCTRLDVIELDRDLIPDLEKLRARWDGLHIHQADALKFDLRTIQPEGASLRLVGNLPYNISTPLMFHLLAFSDLIQDMHFMLQKEVVQRMAAQAGEPAYGRLSVMVQYRCAVEDLFHIPPQAFTPPPQVDSALVHLKPHATLPLAAQDEDLFARLVRQAFSMRRKTLRNALKGVAHADHITAAGIDPGARPETLSVVEYVQLSNFITTVLT